MLKLIPEDLTVFFLLIIGHNHKNLKLLKQLYFSLKKEKKNSYLDKTVPCVCGANQYISSLSKIQYFDIFKQFSKYVKFRDCLC